MGLIPADGLSISRFQEIETVPLSPNITISGRNMHQIWTDGKSILQLDPM